MLNLISQLGSQLVSVAKNDVSRLSLTRFCREVLGYHPWQGQRELYNLIQAEDANGNPLHREVLCATGHGVGKTSGMSNVICWWLARHPRGIKIITSAPTYRQVDELLWSEVRHRWNNTPRLRSLGRCRGTVLRLDNDRIAYGFSTDEPERFQGWHAPVLRFVIDEANGFPDTIWDSIKTCMTGDNSQLIAIGNAVVAQGRFYETWTKGTVKGKLQISSRRHPNVITGRDLIPGAVTRRWIEDFELENVTLPAVIASRIDAIFPDSAEDLLITRQLLATAVGREARITSPVVGGVDVARYGSNLTVVARQRGQFSEQPLSWSRASTTTTVDKIMELHRADPFDALVVDDDGVGGGVVDELSDQLTDIAIVPFRGGLKPVSELSRCVNRISEAWFRFKESLDGELQCIDRGWAEQETQQLTNRRYGFDRKGAFKIESKPEYCRRTGLSSPDFADARVMAWDEVINHWTREAVAA